MVRALLLACACFSASGRAWGFDEPAVADRNLAAIIVQLETGNWNARIHAVHELEYMQAEGLPGLALATEDGDWQVRMTAVHAIGPSGVAGAPILNKLLRFEPCPVVRLMTLHNLGSLGPEGEEAKAMGWISDASTKEVNACRDQPGPGRAPWARGKGGARAAAIAPPAEPAPRPRPSRRRVQAPAPSNEGVSEEREGEVVTRDPVLPAAVPAKKSRPPENLPAPTKFQRHIELDALLDSSTASVTRPGVALAMKDRSAGIPEAFPAEGEGRRRVEPAAPAAPAAKAVEPRRGVALEMRGRSTGTKESLPWPVGQVPREHEVTAPGAIMKDAGGKAEHDPLPGLLRALRGGDARTRARAADDLGHFGEKAAPAVPALIDALRDRDATVRSSAGLALGNIGTLEASVVPLLTRALKDRSEDVRYAAALALSRIDSPEARDAFSRHVGKEARLAIDRPRRAGGK